MHEFEDARSPCKGWTDIRHFSPSLSLPLLQKHARTMQRVQSISSQISAPPAHAALSLQPRKLQYTLETNVLTREQREFYEENGYIIIPRLVTEEHIDEYAARFKELCENPKERPSTMTVMRDVALAKAGVNNNSEMFITKVQDFQDDPALFAFCQDPNVLKYVEAWTGPRIVATHTMVRALKK